MRTFALITPKILGASVYRPLWPVESKRTDHMGNRPSSSSSRIINFESQLYLKLSLAIKQRLLYMHTPLTPCLGGSTQQSNSWLGTYSVYKFSLRDSLYCQECPTSRPDYPFGSIGGFRHFPSRSIPSYVMARHLLLEQV